MTRRWDVLASFINEENFISYVEVGCKEGRTVMALVATCPTLRSVAAIDLFENQPDKTETYEDWDWADIKKTFHKNFADAKRHRSEVPKDTELAKKWVTPPLCHMELVEKDSHEYVKTLPNGSTDLVFIDACHDYEAVMQDIKDWLPIVRSGGILSGHDYQHKFPEVMRAVAASFNLMGVELAPDSVWWVRKA